jgi:hypothetical protein
MKLVVVDLSEEWEASPDAGTFVYRKSSAPVRDVDPSRICDDAVALTGIGVRYRDRYASLVADLRPRFDALPILTAGKNSLFSLTDVSCKRSEFFPTFNDFCHLKLIERRIEELGIRAVRFVGVTPEFAAAARSSAVIRRCDPSFERERRSEFGYSLRSYLLSQSAYFLRTTVQLILCKLLFSQRAEAEAELFFTRYPLQLDRDLREEKYGELAAGKSFLVSVFSDGMHQKVRTRDYLRHLRVLRGLRRRVILLDREVRLRDVISQWVRSYRLYGTVPTLLQGPLCLDGIDLGEHLRQEARFSMLRLPRLLLHERAFAEVFAAAKPRSICYYLHEYPWGRLISQIAGAAGVHRIGFQHGPSGLLRLNYVLAPGEAGTTVPIPDELLAEDAASRDLYESFGYRRVRTMDRIYRLSYLSKIKRDAGPAGVLVACGLHDGDYLLASIAAEIRARPEETFYLRLHPRANREKALSLVAALGLPNLALADGPLPDWLARVREVWYSYSSVGLEARLLGIETRVIWPRDRVFEYLQENPNA